MWRNNQKRYILYYATKIRQESGEIGYKEYYNALKKFINKSFDATNLITSYWKKIQNLDEEAVRDFIYLLSHKQFRRTDKPGELPFGNADISQLDVHVYSQISAEPPNDKYLYCDLGANSQSTGKENLMSENMEEFLSSVDGIEVLANRIDEKVEKTLDSELNNIVEKAQKRIEEKKRIEELKETFDSLQDLMPAEHMFLQDCF